MDNFTPISSLAGGLLIGLGSVWLLAANGRIAGVSGILHGLAQPPGERLWRASFLGGLIAAGILWPLVAEPLPLRDGPGLAWVALAGGLVGYGSRLGSGCTSGHGICGLARLSLRSLVAVITFVATGIAAAYVVRHLLGVAP